MLLSNYAICSKTKSIFIKNKEINSILNDQFEINKIINKLLLSGDIFLPEWHLKQPGFTYSACRQFTRYPESIKKFKETGHLKHLYRNELKKAYFAHDAAYSDTKDLTTRTISDKIVRYKAYEIAKNRGYDRYQSALVSIVYKFFDKKAGSGETSKV